MLRCTTRRTCKQPYTTHVPSSDGRLRPLRRPLPAQPDQRSGRAFQQHVRQAQGRLPFPQQQVLAPQAGARSDA